MSGRWVGLLEVLVGGLREIGRLGVGSSLRGVQDLLHVRIGCLESVVILLSLQRIFFINYYYMKKTVCYIHSTCFKTLRASLIYPISWSVEAYFAKNCF